MAQEQRRVITFDFEANAILTVCCEGQRHSDSL